MSQNAGRVGFTLKGAYDASTTYTMLNVVTYQGGSYAAKSTTTGNAPTNTTYWQKLTDTEVATVNSLGVVQPDGTSVTIDANGVISATASAGVASFNGRTGAVVPVAGDYNAAQVDYDNTDSGLTSNRVQGAIDELTPKKIITTNDAFDPTKTYSAGEWFIHQGVLYEVITACTGVTPPNATYYEVKTVHDLQDDIVKLKDKIRYIDVDIRGVEINKGSTALGGFYSNAILVDFNGATPLSASVYGAFDQGITVVLQSTGIVLQSPISRTVTSSGGAQRYVRVVCISA